MRDPPRSSLDVEDGGDFADQRGADALEDQVEKRVMQLLICSFSRNKISTLRRNCPRSCRKPCLPPGDLEPCVTEKNVRDRLWKLKRVTSDTMSPL